MKVPLFLVDVDENADPDELGVKLAEHVAALTGLPVEGAAPEGNILKADIPFPHFHQDDDGDFYKLWEGEVSLLKDGEWVDSDLSPAELLMIAKRVPDKDGIAAMTRTTTSTRAREGISAEVEVVKSDDYENLAFGWANVAFTADGAQIVDAQGHLIDVEELESTAYNFVVKGFGSGDMHDSDDFGELVESVVFTREKMERMGLPEGTLPEAWWLGFRLPPEQHAKVRSGERTMFSIEGSAKLHPFDG
jgi:hypothetical protein